MTDPILFALAAMVLLAAPGPTNTLLATAGAARGVVPSLRLVAAALVAYALAIACYRLVLAPLMSNLPILVAGLRVAVAIYVAWLAVRLWRSTTSIDQQSAGAGEVFVATLLNPKGFVVALTLLPAGVDITGHLVIFALVVVAASIGWLVIGRAMAASIGDRHEHLIPRIASVALVGFAGLIAASVFG